jgi:hypothetical protein
MKGPLVLPPAPIEFVLVGPVGGRDRILAKSKDAGLDLLALAMEPALQEGESSSVDFAFFIFGGTQTNVISSSPASDIDQAADRRDSRFNFAWKGLTTPLGKQRLEKVLNSRIQELRIALKDEDLSAFEMALAPLMYGCTREHRRRNRRRLLLISVLVTYGLGILIAGSFELLNRYFDLFPIKVR